MLTTTFRVLLLATACLLTTTRLLAADGVLILETTTLDGKAHKSQVQITKDRVRAEMVSGAGEVQAVIFDATKQVLWMIDNDKKTYTELTKADVDRLGAQMNDVMAKLQEQLKSLPPEQRARMEEMMKGRGMPGMTQPRKTEYKRTGTDKVGKWTCAKYEGFSNGQKTTDLCTVEPKDLGITMADLEVTRQLGEFFRKMMPQNAESIFSVGTPEEQGFSGVPVRRASRVGNVQSVTELSEIARQNIPDSAFALPTGFRKAASPFQR